MSQSTLTELKAMEFESSQAAVSILSPFLPLCGLSAARDVECIYCRSSADSCVDYLNDFTKIYIKTTQYLSSVVGIKML